MDASEIREEANDQKYALVQYPSRSCRCENNGDLCEYCSLMEEIRTENVCPPIPLRNFDWAAWIDGDEELGTGRGATKQEAINDLLDILEAR
jgi:hypothetical protein